MNVVRTTALEQAPDLLKLRPDWIWLGPETQVIGWGQALKTAAGFGPERFQRAQRAFADWLGTTDVEDELRLPGTGPIAFSSFTFDERSPGSVLAVPSLTVGQSAGQWFVTTVGDTDPRRYLEAAAAEIRVSTDRPRFAGASIPDVQWLEAVARAVDLIEHGEVSKVVLARDFALWSKVPFDPMHLVTKLHHRFPECYTFLVDGLVGASPELLIRMQDRQVLSQALAGSARRSDDPAEDERIGKALLASDKDRREHESAAASVGRVLGEVCSRLERDLEPRIVKLANVQHLGTRFSGRLARSLAVLDLVDMLHPTAAVGGTPTGRAVELIRSLEAMDRGRYAGPVGWMDAQQNGEFAIALRCAELSGARARLFAGAGIVSGSLPENELEETRLKLLAMQSAFE